MGLRPEKSETLQSAVPLGFAAGVSYSRTHSASSRRPIGDDNVCAGAFERSHNLKNGRAFLYDSFFGSRFDHRVFAAHMINGGRFAKTFAHPPEDIDVRQSWFYHHDVRAFIDIQSNFTQRFRPRSRNPSGKNDDRQIAVGSRQRRETDRKKPTRIWPHNS